jgi:HlyD family secretion protein
MPVSKLSLQSVRKPILIAAIAIALVAAIWFFFAGRGARAAVIAPQLGPIKQTLVFSARVSAIARTDIASTITARVERVLVREGDRVKAGQTLVELDNDELSAQLAQASAALNTAQTRLRAQSELTAPVASQTLAQAQTNLDFARRELERNRSLHEKGFIGLARLQDSERAVAVAESALAQARSQATGNAAGGAEAQGVQSRVRESEAAVALARARNAQARIVAPADGRIVLRSVEVGDVVQPGRRLLSLAADGETRLIAQIDEKNLSLLREGQKASATTDAFPDKAFVAELSYLSPSVDATRGTVEARLRVAEPPAYLRDDMTVSVEVVAAQKAQALTLPANALREKDSKSYVLAAIDGRAKRLPVSVGIRSALRVEILDGVTNATQIILEPAIGEGQRVRTHAASASKASDFEPPMPGR